MECVCEYVHVNVCAYRCVGTCMHIKANLHVSEWLPSGGHYCKAQEWPARTQLTYLLHHHGYPIKKREANLLYYIGLRVTSMTFYFFLLTFCLVFVFLHRCTTATPYENLENVLWNKTRSDYDKNAVQAGKVGFIFGHSLIHLLFSVFLLTVNKFD